MATRNLKLPYLAYTPSMLGHSISMCYKHTSLLYQLLANAASYFNHPFNLKYLQVQNVLRKTNMQKYLYFIFRLLNYYLTPYDRGIKTNRCQSAYKLPNSKRTYNSSILMRFILSFLLLSPSIAYSAHRVNTLKATENNVIQDSSLPNIPSEWKKYLDAESREFWKEGNHLPDEGFLLLLTNRTLDNAKLWLLRMEKKAEVAEEVMALVLKAQEELVKEGKIKDRYGMVMSNNPEYAPIKKLYQEQLKSLTYFFIFKPGCHACIKTAGSLADFPNVMPLQATQGELYQWDNLPNTRKASRETLNDYANDGSVPVIVIADPMKNRVSKLKGLQTKKQIMEASINLLKLRFGEKKNDKS